MTSRHTRPQQPGSRTGGQGQGSTNFEDAVRHHPVSYKDLQGIGFDDDDDEFDPVGSSDSHLPDVLRNFQRHAQQQQQQQQTQAQGGQGQDQAQRTKLSAADQLMAQFSCMAVEQDEHNPSADTTSRGSASTVPHDPLQHHRPLSFPTDFSGSGVLRAGQLPEGAMSLEELEAQLLGTTPGAMAAASHVPQTQGPGADLDLSSNRASPSMGAHQAHGPGIPPAGYFGGPMQPMLPPGMDLATAVRLGFIPPPHPHFNPSAAVAAGLPPHMMPPYGMIPPPGMMPPGPPPTASSPNTNQQHGPSPSMGPEGFPMPPPPPAMSQEDHQALLMSMPGMPVLMPPMPLGTTELPAHLFAGMSPEEMARAMAENSEQQLRAIRKARREARMRESARFNGIMSQREKDLVARIQIGQLVTADPMVDDYYFQVFDKARTAAKEAADAEAAAAATRAEDAEAAGESSQVARTSVDGGNGASNLRQDRRRYAHNNNNNNNNNNNQGNRPLLLRKAIREGSLQDQIDRIVDHAKKKTRNTQISLDGALGKISLKTTKNPRQQLHLSSPDASTAATSTKSASPTSPAATTTPLLHGKAARRLAHKVTEELYDLVLACESLHLSRPTAESKRGMVVDEDGDERPLTIEEETGLWEQELVTALDKLWGRLQQFEAGDVHPVVQMLSMSKGKKLWPRLVNMLSTPHVTKVALDMFGRAQQLDVVRQASIPALFAAPQLFPGLSSSRPSMDALLAFVGDVEDYMQYVLPSLVMFISEAPWPVVSSSLEAVLDRNDMVRLGSSKVGLALLTMLVSRAEILSQSNQAPGWPELYLRVFNELQGHYLAFFPVSAMANLPDSLAMDKLPAVLVPPVLPPPSAGGPTAADLLDFYLTDDAHVWQFLASLAVAATVEQQTLLVTEVRERILANVVAGQMGAAGAQGEAEVTAADKAERAVYNVNLFLHALGLDASQIQTAM